MTVPVEVTVATVSFDVSQTDAAATSADVPSENCAVTANAAVAPVAGTVPVTVTEVTVRGAGAVVTGEGAVGDVDSFVGDPLGPPQPEKTSRPNSRHVAGGSRIH